MSNDDEHSFLLLERERDGETQEDTNLFVSEFNGTEEISVPFSFELGMSSSRRDITYEDYIGQNVTVSFPFADTGRRYFNGIISRFAQVSSREEDEAGRHVSYYTAEMVPWLWLLTRYANSRIFQGQSVPQIVRTIFEEKEFRDHEFKVQDSDYEPRIYCVQYRETDFNFVSRLLEEEGIFYFFKHEQGRHILVLADAPGHHLPDTPDTPMTTARCAAGATFDSTEPDVITSFQKMQEIRFGAYTLRDYNSELQDRPIIQVGVESKYAIGPGVRELYDYPGLYSAKKSGDRLVNIRMQEEEARVTTITGSSFCRSFTAGAKVKVRDPEDYYRDDLADRDGKDYILVSVSHMASQRIGPSGRGEGGTYANNFSCIPDDPNVPYRPPRYTPKPVVQGTQTAIVVGRRSDEQSDEEIYTDGPCQVKVKFHWDRSDQKSEQKSEQKSKQKSDHSCWIRVAQLWADKKWGGVYVPRIGQEVIVDFLEGDPDRPIIIGCVYNAINPPPYEDGKTSGIKSNTTKGGGGYNEISMTDTKDEEAITIHAQKDMNTTVENDQSVTLKSGSRTITVESGTCTETSSGDYSITSKSGAVKITGKGKGVDITGNEMGVGVTGYNQGVSIIGWDRGVEIQANDAPATVQGNTDGVTITGKGKGVTVDGKAGDGVKIVAGGNEVTVDGQAIKITGKNSIVLSVGKSNITIDSAGVKASGTKVDLNP